VPRNICWGIWSVLSTIISHFPELEAELELIGSGCNAHLMEDLVDVLWAQTR
jgi:hypothetical protein